MAILAGPVGAKAAPIIYFGENQMPAGAVSGDPLAARNTFLGNLSGVGTEGFESISDGTTLTPSVGISFPGSSGGITATLSGAGRFFDTAGFGRFNTTPGGDTQLEAEGAFSIVFGSAVSAFGFYGTDIGNFSGQVTVTLTDINDVATVLTIGNTVNGLDGSLLFWGFIDSANAYKSIAFGNTSNTSNLFDVFGFDDFVIGDRQQIVATPEPGTLALLGLGLVGLGLGRRRKAE